MLTFFISSTFNDMQAERDIIRQQVAPSIRRKAALYGQSVRFLDLRWGVNTERMTEQEASQKVLDVCLDGIDRSDYIIALLGQRYGWVLDYSRLSGLSERDLTLSEPISVTELEIRHGILRHPARRAIALFRDSVEGLPPDLQSVYTDEATVPRLAGLRQELETLPACRVEHYVLRYTDEGFDGLQEFADRLRMQLEELVDQTFRGQAPLTPEQLAFNRFSGFLESRASPYLPVPELETGFTAFWQGQTRFLLVEGTAGMGKSAFLARLCQRCGGGNVLLLPWIGGLLPDWNSPEALLRYLMARLSAHFGVACPGEALSCAALCERFSALLYRIDETAHDSQQVLFLLDAPEKLNCPPEEVLNWLPQDCPARFRFVITTSPDCLACKELYHYLPVEQLIIPPLADPGAYLRRLLLEHGKELPGALAADLPAGEPFDNYLYNELVLRLLLLIDRHDFAGINAGGGGIDAINRFLRQRLHTLPRSLPALGLELLQACGERTAPLLARNALGAIAVSPRGLRSSDLEALFPTQWDEADFFHLIYFLDDLIEESGDGCFHFSHAVLRQAAIEQADSDLVDGVFAHIASLPDNDPVKQNGYLLYALHREPPEAVAAFVNANRALPVLAEQLRGRLTELTRPLARLLRRTEVLEWFLEAAAPGLTRPKDAQCAALLLRQLGPCAAPELERTRLRRMALFYTACGRHAAANEAWRALAKLQPEDGALYFYIAETTFVNSQPELDALLADLNDCTRLLGAKKAPTVREQSFLWQARLYLRILDVWTGSQKEFHPIRTVYDFARGRNTSQVLYLDSLTKVFLASDMIGKMLELEEARAELYAWLRGVAETLLAVRCREEDDIDALYKTLLLLVQLMQTGREDPGLTPLLLRIQAHMEGALRGQYRTAVLLQLAKLDALLARQYPETDPAHRLCLEQACQIWQKCFTLRPSPVPVYAGDLSAALLKLALLRLRDGGAAQYEETLLHWFRVEHLVRFEKAEAAYEQCRRYPDEVRLAALQRERRSIHDLRDEYFMRFYLREQYKLFSTVDMALQLMDVQSSMSVRMDYTPFSPAMYYAVMRLYWQFRERREGSDDKRLPVLCSTLLYYAYRVLAMIEQRWRRDGPLTDGQEDFSSLAEVLRHFVGVLMEWTQTEKGFRGRAQLLLALAQKRYALAVLDPEAAEAQLDEALAALAVLERLLESQGEDIPADHGFADVSMDNLRDLRAKALMLSAGHAWKRADFGLVKERCLAAAVCAKEQLAGGRAEGAGLYLHILRTARLYLRTLAEADVG